MWYISLCCGILPYRVKLCYIFVLHLFDYIKLCCICLPKALDWFNKELTARQDKDSQCWQSERINRRRNLDSKRMREKEEKMRMKEKDIPWARSQTQEAVNVRYTERKV